MLALFKELGNSSPLTQKYRKLMQRLLYWKNFYKKSMCLRNDLYVTIAENKSFQ